MARHRKNTAEDAPTDAPRGPSRVFARRPSGERGALTHDTLAADLATFHRAGGTIEGLGTTMTRRRIDLAGTADSPAPRPPPTGKSRR